MARSVDKKDLVVSTIGQFQHQNYGCYLGLSLNTNFLETRHSYESFLQILNKSELWLVYYIFYVPNRVLKLYYFLQWK